MNLLKRAHSLVGRYVGKGFKVFVPDKTIFNLVPMVQRRWYPKGGKVTTDFNFRKTEGLPPCG